MSYQKHIDGLRAIAIAWVVAYHYFPQVFRGGFIGVDVFFVISGYLISGIIWRELDQGRFSFLNFYVRRVRRIFPALLTVLGFTSFVGFHLLHDGELMQLAKHTLAASLFLNNWVLSIEKGYFDIGSEYKPLLHLWSLSIEEQFYLLWPLVLFGLARLGQNASSRRWVIGSLMFCSLLACLTQTFTRPVGAFYSPHTRVWELIAGAVLHLLPMAYQRKLGIASAWALPVLVLGLFGLHAQLPFPGYWALLPVICAMSLLLAPAQSLASRWLSSRPMVALGLISYPLYLWHWPLIAFAQLYLGDSLGTSARLSLLGLAVLLSLLTHRFIEHPLRHGSRAGLKALMLVACMAVLATLAVWTHHQNGFPNRDFNQRNLSLNSGDVPSVKPWMSKSCPQLPQGFECWRSTDSDLTQAVVGDSKGKAFFTGLLQHTQGRQGWFYLGGNAKDGAPIPQAESTQGPHQGVLDRTVDALDQMPQVKRVVLAVALRSLYGLKTDDSVLDLADKTETQRAQVHQALEKALRRLAQHDREVWVLIDNPTFLNPPRCVTRHIGWAWADTIKTTVENGCGMSLQTHLSRTQIYRDTVFGVQQKLKAQGIEIQVIDALSQLCDLTTQRCEMTKNGRYLYDFTDHMSGYGAHLVAQFFLQGLSRP